MEKRLSAAAVAMAVCITGPAFAQERMPTVNANSTPIEIQQEIEKIRSDRAKLDTDLSREGSARPWDGKDIGLVSKPPGFRENSR
jgi:hypothetical protein